MDAGLSEKSSYEKLKQFLIDKYDNKKSSFLLQAEFNRSKQQIGETVQNYADRLEVLGKKAYIGADNDLMNKTLCNQFVNGVISK